VAERKDRRLLWQTHDLVHGFNNLLLHQTPVSLGLVAHAGEKGVEFDVGPSDMHIRAALFGAFWPYSQTFSLVLTGTAQDELQRLYTEHLPAFTTERSVRVTGPGGFVLNARAQVRDPAPS
jgi:hypothetical protein